MAAKGYAKGLTNYGDPGFSRFVRGAFMRQMGFDGEDMSKPIIGIFNTYSELNPCHRGFRELAPQINRRVQCRSAQAVSQQVSQPVPRPVPRPAGTLS